ncbi:deoxynucleoside kinase [Clostridium sp. MSJ-4]|uniref:Thymidylate kinase n=1 Tax=Clostridium simiarum TaxID=2841506 RepID=A0ABS6F1D5_9CLOT|nr:deoxynucleoside kinase [Clostridium amazonitimonense]MBU5591699.1 deoxynucleoside kinase [Clostridium simiarum]
MNKGKLIIIEGADGSGKKTQSDKLYQRLSKEINNIIKVEYPNYKSESSSLVKMYLKGDFGNSPGDVSPYVSSTFFAADRYASYKKEWEKFYIEGGVVIADRYTTSNMVHQASKIEDEEEKERFLNWLWNFEFEMYKLPVPDLVLFLDMSPEYSKKLIKHRENKFTGDSVKDIHESHYDYLMDSYNNAVNLANKYNWIKINCVDNGIIKSIDEIHEEIYVKVMEYIRDITNL